MCIDVEFEEADSGEIASICEEVIRQNMARVSDPGFAVCCLDRLSDPDRLIEFGFEAKRKVKKKDEAYALASGIEGVILKELGGTGGGVIGALAGYRTAAEPQRRISSGKDGERIFRGIYESRRDLQAFWRRTRHHKRRCGSGRSGTRTDR